MANTSNPSNPSGTPNTDDSSNPETVNLLSPSQPGIVPSLKSRIPPLLKNIPPLLKLLKKYPIKSIFGLLTALLTGGSTQEGLRTNAWRMVGGTLDSAPLGGHRIYYDFTKKSVTSEFVLSKKMRDNIVSNPIKEIKIDITFDPDQPSAELYVKDMNGNFDQIPLSRRNGILLNPNEKDKYSFTIDDELKRAHKDIISVISIDAVNFKGRKGSFIVENISMK